MSVVAPQPEKLLTFVAALASGDPRARSFYADDAARWSLESWFTPAELSVLGQVCIWAWVIEADTDVAADLLDAVSALQWDVAGRQIAGVNRAIDRSALTPATAPSVESIDEFLAEKSPQESRLLDADACQRAVDLARGLTSSNPRERLEATRLSADVVASRTLADEEAGCFAGLLSYAVVVESDPTVRHEQATALGIAAHHGRLAEGHREVALTADLTDAERSALSPST